MACDSTPSILYRNNHDGTFTDVAVTAGAAFNEDGREQAGMGIDGRRLQRRRASGHFQDKLFRRYFHALRNNGDGTFTDATSAAGLGLYTQYLGWGTMFFDFDNDGWPDLILVNGHVYPEVDSQHLGSNYKEPRILYHNNGDGTFADISASAGTGHYHRSFFARAGGGRFVERRQDVGGGQQHECGAQPAGEPDSDIRITGSRFTRWGQDRIATESARGFW